MGWSSGAGIAAEVWDKFRPLVPEIKRKEYARFLYDLFSDHDADTWDAREQLEQDAGLADEEGNWIDDD